VAAIIAPGRPELENVRMLENEPQNGSADAGSAASPENAKDNNSDVTAPAAARKTTRRRTTSAAADSDTTGQTPAKTTRTRARKAAPASKTADSPKTVDDAPTEADTAESGPRTRRRRSASATPFSSVNEAPATARPTPETEPPDASQAGTTSRVAPATALFVAPVVEDAPQRASSRGSGAARTTAPAETTADDGDSPARAPRSRRRSRRTTEEPVADATAAVESTDEATGDDDEDDEAFPGESAATRRRRRRGRRGRGRGKGPHDDPEFADEGESSEAPTDEAVDAEGDADAGDAVTRRRRKRRRSGAGADESASEDGVVTVVKIREPRAARDEVQGVTGSTRLEAKRQRRRDGREQRRTRPSILSESEFLARREAVERVMAIRKKGDRTQIAVLEDGVLVEHYVARASSGTMVGNVYLGKVQNVLPSMEAAFVDIGRGRNAVLYAGEVNWDMAGLEGKSRSIELAMKAGDPVLVQVTKDPIGHKGARLTSHVALSGRHLVYVPNGHTSGISRKLSDVERKRLRDILKKLIPEGAGVIVRTAAEGASEADLARDVTRLQAQWEDIEAKVASGNAPAQLYEEPDLVIRVVRDLFNEDFRELVIQGSDAYDTVESYLSHVSPDLVERLRRHSGAPDIFATYRIDEQILKGLDRKVFLPSGGSLVIDRTEAMTVIDVNTGKYTGTGGNLEETVTRNNLEAAEEIVRQLRLRDLGGIVVIDFIDMVLESNRELVLRRLTECLGRDRTKHQVTEITSLGLVQMTRKRIGQGLLEAFSETCEHCKGRGVIVHLDPVPERRAAEPAGRDYPQRETSRDTGDSGETASGRRRSRRTRGGSATATHADATSVGETAEATSGADAAPGDADLHATKLDDAVVESADLDEDEAADLAEVDDEEFESDEDDDDSDDVDLAASDSGGDDRADRDAASVPPVATTNGYAASVPAPAPSGWVNLGEAPPIGSTDDTGASGPPDDEAASGSIAGSPDESDAGELPEVEALESESDSAAETRRGSRWRRRP